MNNRIKNPRWTFWVITLLGALLLTGCEKKEPSASRPEDPASEARKVLYQCPMHPQIIKEEPGDCPICGMKLVPIEEEALGENASTQHGPSVQVDPAVIQNIGMRTDTVRPRALPSELRANGRVTVDEDRVFSVTARVSGYVEKLRVTSVGQAVRPGETLVELYSPELVTAQQEYLQADNPGPEARERLLNWGVSSSFIAGLEKSRRPGRLVPLSSPLGGTVTRKEVVAGQAVSPGMELFRIANLSEVWVTARVYQVDLARVKIGSRTVIRLRNLPDQPFECAVIFISPEMDPATRTAEIRMKLRNTPALDLRPEMFAEVRISGKDTARVLAVPAQSLIRTGGRDMAVVSLGGGIFQPREVKVGRETGEWIEILDGLKEGDEVVVSAQFLIDSESNLRAAVEQLRGASHER